MSPELILTSVFWGAFLVGFAFNHWGRAKLAGENRLGQSLAAGMALALLALPFFALASITASLASIARSLSGAG